MKLNAKPAKSSLPFTLLVALAALSGCSSDKSTGGHITGEFATVYSSLPLQGSHANQAQDVLNAEKLALRQANAQAGKFKINFAFSDDATAQGTNGTPGWNADKAAGNARSAVQNGRTIGYIGDFDSSATAISLPITNEAGIVQISPASTAVGLTRYTVGSDKGEPDKFYPSGKQNFARVVPGDDVQASAAARWAKQLGARSVFLLGDKSLRGDALVDQFRFEAGRLGLLVADQKTMDPLADEYADLVQRIAKSDADAVFFGGGVESNAVALWRALHQALPGKRLIGPDGLLVPDFYEKIGDAAADTYLTSSVQDPAQLPPRGKRFLHDYRSAFGKRPGPYAAYGYASMQLILDAIDRAGKKADRRDDVVEATIATKDLETPVGRFSIEPNGDSSLDRIAAYRISGGKPVFDRGLTGARAPDKKPL